MYRYSKQQSGFTLIETLISLGIFSIVVTIVVGALLVLVAGNQRVQGEQSVVTNLTFALDSMTREIRTGTHYNCNSFNGVPVNLFNNQESLGLATADCFEGNNNNHRYQGISFREAGSSVTGSGATRIAYFFDRDARTIRRRVGNGAAESIVSTGIEITNAEFFVTGSTPLGTSGGGDTHQPAVTIVIEAIETSGPDPKPFIVQTTVTQRALDL